jgi:hypothetical protein
MQTLVMRSDIQLFLYAYRPDETALQLCTPKVVAV